MSFANKFLGSSGGRSKPYRSQRHAPKWKVVSPTGGTISYHHTKQEAERAAASKRRFNKGKTYHVRKTG